MAVRLRQAVLAARDLDRVSTELRSQLGLGDPYADPGVAGFGLENAVYAVGDTFLEVVSPVRPDTAAGRYLDARGDGGYMLIFQLDDLAAARRRVAERGIRVVWQIDLPDISGTHLHPGDTRGAIVSLDQATPAQSWRWGGPAWTGSAGPGGPGHLRGVTVAVNDPVRVAALWGDLLGVRAGDRRLDLDRGYVAFEAADEERLVEIHLEVPGRDETVEIGGARFRLEGA